MPNRDFTLDDEMMRTQTPQQIKRSSSVSQDLFGRKFSAHRRSVDGMNHQQVNVAEIGFEIRSQLD